MIELLELLTNISPSVAKNIISTAVKSLVENCKESYKWKKLVVRTGKNFIENRQEDEELIEELEKILSKENLIQIAKDSKSNNGYELKITLHKCIMELMIKYEIPHEIAEYYTNSIIHDMFEQLKNIDPIKYGQYFMCEWRDEDKKELSELKERVEKISKDIEIYFQEKLSILHLGQMDIELRQKTNRPSIGIDFFVVDDNNFKKVFKNKKQDEIIYIKVRNKEEGIYCVLNELRELDDKRPMYVVKNLESWNKLRALNNEGNVYIPDFYADEIIAIENNTNIFVIDENIPISCENPIELRPRTLDTISRCLNEAGMDYEKINNLIVDTHGLYSQIKKQIFRGKYSKLPKWIDKVSERAKKTCLLIGQWEEIDGDKIVIEQIYGDTYDNFIEEIRPYTKGDDPLIYIKSNNRVTSYCLASTENIWSCINVSTNENIWNLFIESLFYVINESENLFTYNPNERMIAVFKGEKLFWSETIRKGMLRTLLIKGAYHKNDETDRTQIFLDDIVKKILDYVKTEKQWKYISKFWPELCEISPVAVLERLENEMSQDTGLLSLFKNQSDDFTFGRNVYVDILWGIEQFLSQREYFWKAFRILLSLDSYNFEYKSNSIKDIFNKVFCVSINFSAINTSDEKILAAKLAFDSNKDNAWEYLYSAIDFNGETIIGKLSIPKYRKHEDLQAVTIEEIRKTYKGYFELVEKYVGFSVNRWKKLIYLSRKFTKEVRVEVFNQLKLEIKKMTDEEVMQIKHKIRSIIYSNRYFSNSDWALPENTILEYEKLLNDIEIKTPEYEYAYMFLNYYDGIILNPAPYDQKSKDDYNEKAKQKLIEEKLIEFKHKGYNLTILAKICANEPNSTLGYFLSKYWSDREWNYEVFKILLSVQETGKMAIQYLEGFEDIQPSDYRKIIEKLSDDGWSINILAQIYRIEARKTTEMPIVTYASEDIKIEFWRESISCDEINGDWSLQECKKYACLSVYIKQLYYIYKKNDLSAKQIFEYFEDIERMSNSVLDGMTDYYIQQLLEELQVVYINDTEKCNRIANIEIYFCDLLDWKNMKCFHHILNESPELFSELVYIIFNKDNGEKEKQEKDSVYNQSVYLLYEKAHFCPTEIDGKVFEEPLEQWIEGYKQLLIKNDQESLFTKTLGRLFSFSPIDDDGYEPCEAVRKMIEKYGDEKMINSYKIAVFNRRGTFNITAGDEESKIAESFRKNAQYLAPKYPNTARIFFDLYKEYKLESKRERINAENGWY